MWKLKQPSEELLEWYETEMLPGLITRIKSKKEGGNIILSESIQRILIPTKTEIINGTNQQSDDTSVLHHLLLDKPVELYDLVSQLMKRIIPSYDDEEIVKIVSAEDDDEKKSVRNKYMSTLNKLRLVFDYDGQLSKNKDRAYHITSALHVNTCTYCNRQYTLTIVGDNENKHKFVRPQLDHWFSKQLYPLMSLNIYNLIPSCSNCNSSVKGCAVFNLQTHIHPYLEETSEEPEFRFRFKLNSSNEYEIEIDESSNTKENKMIEDLHIKEVYRGHGELEAKDLILFRMKNSETYLKSIIENLIGSYGYTEREVFRMLFGAEFDKARTLDRPFSKLKRDILNQLGVSL